MGSIKCPKDGGSCVKATCCAAAKCGTQGVTCGLGKYQDASKAGASRGDSDSTAKAACCTAVATCADATTCTGDFKKNTSAASIKCPKDGGSCVKATCCAADAKCGTQGVTCGSGKYQDSTKATASRGTDSGVTACCTAVATCAQVTCETGTLISSAASTKCTGGPSTCVQGTCCKAGTSTATPKQTVLKGSLGMTVPNATAFLTDTDAQNAVAAGIADAVGVPASYVTLIVTIAGSRRLGIQGGRHLAAGQAVKASYTITMPPDAAVTPAAAKSSLETKSVAAITTAIQAKLTAVKGASFKVTVDSKTSVTKTVEDVPAAQPNQVPPKAGTASGAHEFASGVHVLGKVIFLFFLALQKL